MPFLQITPLIPLSSGHSVPALTVQRRGVITPLLWTLSGTQNIQICRFSKYSFFDFQAREWTEFYWRFSPLDIRCRHWMFNAPRNKKPRSLTFNMLLLAVPVFKVKTRWHVEALPKRAPDGHSPLDSLLKFIYQHCVQCYHIIRQSWQKHTSEKLARVWCFQQHSRAPSRSKISPLRSWKAYSPPQTHHPKIVPPHWPQTSVFKESEHRCCPILPQRTSVRNPPNKLPQRLSPNPKDSQIIQTLSHNNSPKNFPMFLPATSLPFLLDAISHRRLPRCLPTQTSEFPMLPFRPKWGSRH